MDRVANRSHLWFTTRAACHTTSGTTLSRNLDVLRIQFHHCCRPKSVQTVHSFVPKIHAFVLATPPQVWLNIQRCAPGRAFLLSTSSIASHERVSLTWVAMYHVFPNASRTAAFRSPYGWSAGS